MWACCGACMCYHMIPAHVSSHTMTIQWVGAVFHLRVHYYTSSISVCWKPRSLDLSVPRACTSFCCSVVLLFSSVIKDFDLSYHFAVAVMIVCLSVVPVVCRNSSRNFREIWHINMESQPSNIFKWNHKYWVTLVVYLLDKQKRQTGLIDINNVNLIWYL